MLVISQDGKHKIESKNLAAYYTMNTIEALTDDGIVILAESQNYQYIKNALNAYSKAFDAGAEEFRFPKEEEECW